MELIQVRVFVASIVVPLSINMDILLMPTLNCRRFVSPLMDAIVFPTSIHLMTILTLSVVMSVKSVMILVQV